MSNCPSDDIKAPYDEKENGTTDRIVVTSSDADDGAALVAGKEVRLDPQEAARIRKKIDLYLLPLMMTLYTVQNVDKSTLGSAAILGIKQTAHLNASEFNWLGSVFWLGYLAFEFPQNLALQRFPVGKWISFNVFIWAIALSCQAACTTFRGLAVCRVFLGVCEGSTTTGLLIVSSMFYTRKEQAYRVCFWFMMNNVGNVILSFVSFGAVHTHSKSFAPWQWLMVIAGAITFVVAIMYWFLFPDNPTNAWFLTPEERIKAVFRIKDNQTGVGNKHFKKDQMWEALTDPKTWLFALFASLFGIQNSIGNQQSLITVSFGFTVIQTTLLGLLDAAIGLINELTAITLAAQIPHARGYVAALWHVIPIMGMLLVTLLPWSNKIGLLAGVWLQGLTAASLIITLGWIANVTAGHTKRITTNTVVLCLYCLGNFAGPFMWTANYVLRYRVPWIVIGINNLICPVLLLTVRYILARENRLRDSERREDEYDHAFVEGVGDGRLPAV